MTLIICSTLVSGQSYLLNSATHNSTITTCSGTFYDSGGPDGEYDNFEDYTITFCSDGVEPLCFEFTEFALEPNPVLPESYDKFYVHDGPTLSSPQLPNSPFHELSGEFISSSGTCLTFRFDSDNSNALAGWSAEIHCSMMCEAMTPLPIDLLSFTATCTDEGVSLDWSTASELNNDKFILERSSDGSTFDRVGTIMGAGNSSSVLHYTFVDEMRSDEIFYYRLTQLDFDGTATTFHPIVADCQYKREFQLYPNPADDHFEIVPIPYVGLVEVGIYDVAGQLVWETSYIMSDSGSSRIEVDTSQLEVGVYTVALLHNGLVSSRKLSILR